jgi:hypothetical protein
MMNGAVSAGGATAGVSSSAPYYANYGSHDVAAIILPGSITNLSMDHSTNPQHNNNPQTVVPASSLQHSQPQQQQQHPYPSHQQQQQQPTQHNSNASGAISTHNSFSNLPPPAVLGHPQQTAPANSPSSAYWGNYTSTATATTAAAGTFASAPHTTQLAPHVYAPHHAHYQWSHDASLGYNQTWVQGPPQQSGYHHLGNPASGYHQPSQ